MSTLHVCLDEAGTLRFTPASPPYYVFAATWTHDPAPLARDLENLRYSLLKNGHDLHSFHASEDRQVNRDAVVRLLAQHTNWRFAAIIVDKRKVNPSIREPRRFYPKFAGMLLRFIFSGWLAPDTTRVLACTDTLPMQRHRDAVQGAFRSICRVDLPRSLPFEIYHHPRASNYWLQVADYCCWAIYRKWERGDRRTYDQLAGRLAKPELDVFRYGDQTRYY